MVSPTTLPRFHSSVAPSACPYHLAAAVASGTASINEITGPPVSDVIFSLLGAATVVLQRLTPATARRCRTHLTSGKRFAHRNDRALGLPQYGPKPAGRGPRPS